MIKDNNACKPGKVESSSFKKTNDAVNNENVLEIGEMIEGVVINTSISFSVNLSTKAESISKRPKKRGKKNKPMWYKKVRDELDWDTGRPTTRSMEFDYEKDLYHERVVYKDNNVLKYEDKTKLSEKEKSDL